MNPNLTPAHRLFIVLALLWLLYEFGFGLRPGKAGGEEGRRADRGSWILLTVSVTAGVLVSSVMARRFHWTAPYAGWGVDAIAISLILAAAGLRQWAMRALGAAFTSRVAVGQDQRLVKEGPYRYVRHPAYLGNVMGFVGIAVGQGSLPSGAVLLAFCIPPVLYRIQVEEKALRARLGKEWEEYSAKIPRLLPGIW